jgi:hypothetical protein
MGFASLYPSYKNEFLLKAIWNYCALDSCT